MLIFYNANNKKSFEYAKQLCCEKKNNNNIIILIRSKYDINITVKNGEFVSDEEALEFADKNNIFFLNLSNSEKH